MKFRAWYSGGREYRGKSLGAWKRMPKRGFLIAVRYNESPYRDLLGGGDWYWWFGRIETHEEWGQWADQPNEVDPDMLKQGEAVSDEEWEAVQLAAIEAKVW